MPLQVHETSKIDKFFAEIAPLLPAYRYQTVRYLAVRSDKGRFLLHLVLNLSARPPRPSPPTFQTANVFCTAMPLAKLGRTPRALIQVLTSGTIALHEEDCLFPADHSGNHTAHAWPFDGARNEGFEQAGRLSIQGDGQQHIYTQNQDYSREVMANRISYDHLPALATAFGLEFQNHNNFSSDIYVSRVAELVDHSRDASDICTLKVWLAGALSPEELMIALRGKKSAKDKAYPLDVPIERGWDRDAQGDWLGALTFALPSADIIVSAVVSYAGLIQQERAFGPARSNNDSLRTAFAPFNTKGDAFAAVLANQKIKDRNPDELELTVAAILALRGFRVITVDRVPDLQEVPDILAADADGNILVVECTLNLPKSEQKFAKLLRRRETVLRAFAESDHEEIEVIGVLAIPQTEKVLAPFRNEANAHRLVFWNKDDLMRLGADKGPPNSTEIFDSVRQVLAWLDLQQQVELNANDF